jgi:hypothetical protein
MLPRKIALSPTTAPQSSLRRHDWETRIRPALGKLPVPFLETETDLSRRMLNDAIAGRGRPTPKNQRLLADLLRARDSLIRACNSQHESFVLFGGSDKFEVLAREIDSSDLHEFACESISLRAFPQTTSRSSALRPRSAPDRRIVVVLIGVVAHVALTCQSE